MDYGPGRSHGHGPFKFRFGLDGLLGLVPIVGDFLTSSVSLYIIIGAAFLGAPVSALLRMALNVAVENVVDSVPFLGNLLDFYWKANIKNLKLLERYDRNPKAVTWSSRLILVGLCLALLALLVGGAALTTILFKFLPEAL